MTSPAGDTTPRSTTAGCVFCQRIADGDYDYDDRWSVAFRPLLPVTPGHFLVVPRRHVAHALEAPGSAGKAIELAAYLANDMGLEAANFITSAGLAATQSVFHLHVHVVPRRPGDGLVLPWTYQQAELAKLPGVHPDVAGRDADGGTP